MRRIEARQLEFQFSRDMQINLAADSRHKWHSFPAKYPPELPAKYIDRYTEINNTILDPMSGSGTTLIEAQRLHRFSLGADVDPLSIINLKGKFSISKPGLLDEYYVRIREKVENSISMSDDSIINSYNRRFSEKTRKFIEYWFPEESLKQLVVLSDQILKIPDKSVRDFFLMVLSATIITKHGNVCYAADLAHTRPHKVIEKKIILPLDEFEKKYSKIIVDHERSYELNIVNRPVVYHEDARYLKILENSIDLIMTSPPYANNAIDYIRSHKFALVWMNYDIEQIADIRKDMVGEISKKDDYIILPEKTKEVIEMVKQSNRNKGNRLEKYYQDIYLMIKKFHEVLKPNKHAIIVVATSIVDGIDVLTQECIIELAEKVGMQTENIDVRDIDRNKRMMPVSNIVNKNSQIESRMHTEYVLDFKKV